MSAIPAPGLSSGVITGKSCDRFTHRQRRIFLAILGLALLLRVGWMLFAHPQPISDFEEYRQLAAGIVDHQQYALDGTLTSRRLPGYSGFLALCMLVSRSTTWLSFVNVLLTVVICAQIGLLGRRLFGARVGLWAALLAAVYPQFVFLSPVLASEHLFTVLLLLAAQLSLPAQSGGLTRAIMAGASAGLATLTRGDALFFLPFVLLLVACRAPSPGSYRIVRRLLPAALAASAAVVVLLPWYVRNRVVFGPGVGLGTGGGAAFYIGHGPGATSDENEAVVSRWIDTMPETELSREGYRQAWETLRKRPTRVFHDVFQSTVALYSPANYGLWASLYEVQNHEFVPRPVAGRGLWRVLDAGGTVLMGLVALLAFMLGRAAWKWLPLTVVGGLVLANWFCYGVMFHGIPRYRYDVDALACLLAGLTVGALQARWCASAKPDDSDTAVPT